MSGMFDLGGGSGGQTGGAALTFDGAGPLYGFNGQVWAQPHIAVAPLYYRYPDGIRGAPTLHVTPWIGRADRLSATNLDDQPITLNWQGETYIIDLIAFINASDAAGAMAGGLYTNPNKTGEAVLAATQTYPGLDGSRFGAELFEPQKVLRAAPYLYLNLDVAGPANMTFDLVIYGRSIRPYEL